MNSAAGVALRSIVVLSEQPSSELRNALGSTVGEVMPAGDVAQASRHVRTSRAELVLIADDISPPRALRAVTDLTTTCPGTPVVVLADRPSVDWAVRMIRAGAYDYVSGPLDDEALARLLEGLCGERTTDSSDRERFFHPSCPIGVQIVGRSPGLTNALDTLRLVAESRCNPILILGDTGTGKELAARAVHAWRAGAQDRFVAVNCAALTANLLESELFGHVKGAFTGADRDKTGLFEVAESGSILLDEISEMPLELQAKLLRVLQERCFRKVGGTRDIPCNATVIASSNRDLFDEVANGRFRKDLYYRLAVFPISMPPLNDPARRDDIHLLAEFFLRNCDIPKAAGIAGFSADALAELARHDWPGNVRELKNVIDRAVLLESGTRISADSILLDASTSRPDFAAPVQADGADPDAKDLSLETAEREFILRALKETGWQRTRAAALLGITRATLHAKLKRYDIRPVEDPAARTAPAQV